jgi:GTPase Era involved in 16S rRNA processing
MSDIVELAPSRRELRRAARSGKVPVLPAAGSRQEPVRIVVIGEFNSGKTTLVNALAGAPVLPSSFTTHTAYPTVVKFARRPSLAAEIAQRKRVAFEWEQLDGAPSRHICRLHVGMPLDRLKAVRVIDTPGLDLCDEPLYASTLRACRRADTVIWCTPAMQAWRASEQQTWLAMPKSVRRRGILAVTFMDLLRSQSDAARLLARLHADAGDLFSRIVTTSDAGIEPVWSR